MRMVNLKDLVTVNDILNPFQVPTEPYHVPSGGIMDDQS